MAAARHKHVRGASVRKASARYRGKRAKRTSPGVARVAVPVTTAAALSAGALTVLHASSLFAAPSDEAVADGTAPTASQRDMAAPPRLQASSRETRRVAVTARPSPILGPATDTSGGRHVAAAGEAPGSADAEPTPSRTGQSRTRQGAPSEPGRVAPTTGPSAARSSAAHEPRHRRWDGPSQQPADDPGGSSGDRASAGPGEEAGGDADGEASGQPSEQSGSSHGEDASGGARDGSGGTSDDDGSRGESSDHASGRTSDHPSGPTSEHPSGRASSTPDGGRSDAGDR